MKIAVFTPSSGVSGNMILGSLVANGLCLEELVNELRVLPLKDWKIVSSKVTRSGLAGVYVDVQIPHEHTHRHLADIVSIINSSPLHPWVKRKSLEAFRLLATAEATAHGISMEEVHFHEVGAVDAIIDIVGSCVGLHLLGVEAVYSTAIAIGTGTVTCAHGILPVPSPATAYLLQGLSIIPTNVPFELATPTGVALLRALVESWETPPTYTSLSNGMGAGSRDNKERANLLRLTIGEVVGKSDNTNYLEIETIIDDLDLRIWPLLNKKILEAGALDCYARSCLGKKGRSAFELVVIVLEEFKESVLSIIFAHSSTIGLRISSVKRIILKRKFKKVKTRYGEVSVKMAFYKDKPVNAEPEFDECVVLAETADVPLKIVLQAARGVALELLP